MIPLQEKIDLATRELARHSARSISLQQALKRALLDRVTSPAALFTAFGSGAVLGLKAGPDPGDAGQRSDGRTGDDSSTRSNSFRSFHRLLEHASTAANWMAVLPVIAGLWQTFGQTLHGDTAINDEDRQSPGRDS